MEDQSTLTNKLDVLRKENHALQEDLQQCKVDKDFVWNLWKRLQASKPDLASVISMVVSREKEKSEKKDQKILQILEMKDEKIKEMREGSDQAVAEMKQTKERFHDLLIENDELKHNRDAKESELSQRSKDAEDKNQYLSQLVKAYQDEKEKKDQELNSHLEAIEAEKNALRSQIKNLECQIAKLTEDKDSLDSVMETNSALQGHMQKLQKEMEELTTKTEQGEMEHEQALAALKLREAQLQEQTKECQFLSSEVMDKEKGLIRLRAEVAEVKTENDKSLDHIREQAAVIEQMQRMQEQMHQAMANRKQAHEKDTLQLHKSVAELQACSTEYHIHEAKLQERLEVLRENDERHIQELANKERVIEELKEALQGINTAHASPVAKRARHDSEVPCRQCRKLKEKLEDLELEREELSEDVMEKTRRISSLERTLKSALTQKKDAARLSLSPEPIRGDVEIHASKQDLLSAKLDRIQKSKKELNKLLELKDIELVEVRRAHAQRQQRYRLLKDNHKLVVNQLRTYEQEPKEQSPVERPSERALRHHNSDGVWNELAHYKGEYEKLQKERHDVLEELDVLRVQHASNLTTIQELKLCQQEEKNELLDRLTSEDERRELRTTRDAKTLESQEGALILWKNKAVQAEKHLAELTEQVQFTDQENKSLQRENTRLKEDIISIQHRLEDGDREVKERVRECAVLKGELHDMKLQLQVLNDKDQNQKDDFKKDHSPAQTRLEQQARDINIYDEQLKKIADKIISPSKLLVVTPHQVSHPPLRASHATQTTDTPLIPFVDACAESTEEGGDRTECDMSGKARIGAGISRKVAGQHTPSSKLKGTVGKHTPARSGEWASMKQRILSLKQQVAALRTAKDKAVKILADEKALNENLQSELSIVLQRHQVSKNTVQTLSEQLKKCAKENESLALENKTIQTHGNEEEIKRLQEKLKTTSSECSRLSYIVKNLRAETSRLKDELKEAQDRVTRTERDVTQKKSLIEEMKNKLRKARNLEDEEADAVKDLEEKIRRLVEREGQRKAQIDSLKRQFDAETRDRERFQQQYFATQEELKIKCRLLSESRVLRGQAEKAVSEMEAAATHQLQGLANQSQAAISTIQSKLDQANDKVEEFQAFIKTLVDELIADIEKAARATANLEDERRNEQQPTSQQARDTACSILNMTSSDLEDLMKHGGGGNTKENEKLTRKGKETEWKNRLKIVLKKEVPFAVPLLEIMIDIMEERLALARRHGDVSQSHRR